jgi:DNA-binding response OmpR family regulator
MKLLLAEDERDLSAAIARVLKFSKYDVRQAYDGQEAYDALHEEAFDGVILDVMMPKLTGFEVLQKIRGEGNNVPVLILTARSELDDKVLGLDSGADDYLTKPFQVKELLARIRAMLRRKGVSLVEPHRIGDTSLNPDTFELVASKGKVRLTNKEFRLMEYLINNKNMLLSTERIMEAVWDFDSEAEINVVWVFISALRKKLEQIGSTYTIKAVRGVGYQLALKEEK